MLFPANICIILGIVVGLINLNSSPNGLIIFIAFSIVSLFIFDFSKSFSLKNPYVYISENPLYTKTSWILFSIFCSLFRIPIVVPALINVVSNLSYP